MVPASGSGMSSTLNQSRIGEITVGLQGPPSLSAADSHQQLPRSLPTSLGPPGGTKDNGALV